MTQEQAAAQLTITPQTVKNLLYNARQRNDLVNTTSLVAAFLTGITPEPGETDLEARVAALEAMHGGHSHAFVPPEVADAS